jgi:hypothetical protein
VRATVSCLDLVRPFDASCWPATCGGKKVRRPLIFKLTQQDKSNWLASYFFSALFSPLLMFLCLGMDEFIVLFQMISVMM